MTDLPEAVAMAESQTQDETTGSGLASVHHESLSGVNGITTSGDVVHEDVEALKRKLSLLSPLNKSTSYVNSVFDVNNVCAAVPESPIPAMRKQSTIDADEILSNLTVTKSFCQRYMGELAEKSSSRGPRTPMGSSPGSLVSHQSSGRVTRSMSGMMTPPVGSVCPLASGPLVNSQSVGEEEAPAFVSNPSVVSPLNLTTRVSETPEELMAKMAALVPEPEADIVNKIAETPENVEEEAMDTDDTGKEDSSEAKETSSGTDMASNLVTPPSAMLSPVRSVTEEGSVPIPAAIPAGMPHPGGPAPVQIAFSFDTTGSMSQCLDEVRAQLRDIIQRLLGDVPHLQIAVIAHGDYCDASEFYMIKSVDFTNDVNVLTQFVNDVGGTGGGDYDECYEYVLNYARHSLSWKPWIQRSLVMIGDATPHSQDYALNTLNLDWKLEANQLYLQGIHIYAVQCQKSSNEAATSFWEGLAEITRGKYIAMEDFSTIVDLMLAICYKETGAEFLDVSNLIIKTTTFCNMSNGIKKNCRIPKLC